MDVKKKYLLVAGCSHAAGCEIHETFDSKENRASSFGNLLAEKIGRMPINIAIGSQSNSSISRSVLTWFDQVYDKKTMDVAVLVAWTESCRMDIPVVKPIDYHYNNQSIDWFARDTDFFSQVNPGYKGGNPEEAEWVKQYHHFIANNQNFLEVLSANLALQMQFFCEANNYPLLMCNTMHQFHFPNHWVDVYTDLMDSTKYINYKDNDKCFYWYYRNKGYENQNAAFWHHGSEPHALYAEELYQFIQINYESF